MPKLSPETLREVQRAYRRYESEVKAADLADSTEKTYLTHARNFVRWLGDEFTPGETLSDSARRSAR